MAAQIDQGYDGDEGQDQGLLGESLAFLVQARGLVDEATHGAPSL